MNWFGIQPAKTYNLIDLASGSTNYVWGVSRTGTDIINNGITVGLTGNPFLGQQAQYLKLVDIAASYPDSDNDGIPDYSDPDDDNDGLPDWWESLYGNLSPGADGDNDGANNLDEYLAGTHPGQGGSVLEITSIIGSGTQARVSWDSVANKNYRLQKSGSLPGTWQNVYFGTALGGTQSVDDVMSTATTLFYRVELKP